MIQFNNKFSKAFTQQSENIPPNHKEIKTNFDSIMRFSIAVLDESRKSNQCNGDLNGVTEHPLTDVVRLVGKQLQSQYLANLLYQRDESPLPNLFPEEVLFHPLALFTKEGTNFQDVRSVLKTEYVISLNRDLVLPWSWKKSRLITCMALIGQGRRWGQWCQDDTNHHVELWLPMGIAWIYGGNHSISAGIIQGEGEVIPRYVYDISNVYDYVYCDGVNYYRIEDGSIISPVLNAEFAAIFEIGRIMVENSISY